MCEKQSWNEYEKVLSKVLFIFIHFIFFLGNYNNGEHICNLAIIYCDGKVSDRVQEK